MSPTSTVSESVEHDTTTIDNESSGATPSMNPSCSSSHSGTDNIVDTALVAIEKREAMYWKTISIGGYKHKIIMYDFTPAFLHMLYCLLSLTLLGQQLII